MRSEIAGRTVAHDKIPTSVEIPFTGQTMRILQYAAEEADRLMHSYIGTEHLLLGILREERCLAATILTQKGMRLDRLRSEIVDLLNERDTPQPMLGIHGVLLLRRAAAAARFRRGGPVPQPRQRRKPDALCAPVLPAKPRAARRAADYR